MTCATCNAPLPADAVFCPNCGTRPAPAGTPPPAGARTYSGLATIAPMRESAATLLEPGTLFAGRYEIVRKLGEGGMGIVYVAKDTNTNEEMVVKLIHPDLVAGEQAVKRLMAEGLTARQIRHPRIVAVYDVALADGQPYFTMEYIKGVSLRSWMVDAIRSGRETSLKTAAGVIKAMLGGLVEAHRLGVVHRDLKPENVLLCGDPNAGDFDLKILDFGIARAVNAPAASRASGSGGGAVGTPLYMAPEQMTSAEAVGPAADIYSLAVIFYELLMEAPPQARWEPVSRSRPELPKALDDLIEKGLSARPRSRFATATAFEAALDAVIGTAVPTPPPPAPAPSPAPIPGPLPAPTPRPLVPRAGQGIPKAVKIGAAAVAGVLMIIFVVVVVMVTLMGGWQGQGWQGQGDGQGKDVIADPPPAVKEAETQVQDTQPPPPQPTPPQPQVFNASGFWLNANGTRFTAEHDGMNFSARGLVPGYGLVTLEGTLTIAAANFVMRTGSGIVITGVGTPYVCNAGLPHLRYQLADGVIGDFKINHVQ